MGDICTDNRFELIEKYKKELIESTNIETSQDEMTVLDNLLFRFWQMGWLDRLEQPKVDCQKCVFCGFTGFKQFQTEQPKTEERPAESVQNVSDLISRKAAIEAVSKACSELRGVFGRCEDALKALPSAQPKLPENWWKTDHGYMWLCPHCGLPVHSDFEECLRCGTKRQSAHPELWLWEKLNDAIDNAPTIEGRKTGKWEEREVSNEKVIDEWQSARCSVCGKYHTTPYMYYFDEFNYCPNCGARMEK